MKAYSQFVINVHHQNILDQLDHKYLSSFLSPFCPSSTPSFPPFTYLFLSLLHSHPLFPYISLTLSFLDFCYSILVSKLLHILNCSPLVSVSLSFSSLPPSSILLSIIQPKIISSPFTSSLCLPFCLVGVLPR